MTRGLKRTGTGAVLTHRARVPVVCPPCPSETETVRLQLLQVPPGSAEAVNWAELEEAWAQEPAQEALQEYERLSPSGSEAEAETQVVCPTASCAGVAPREATLGALLKETVICAAPCPPLGRTVRSTEALEERPPEFVTVTVSVCVPVVAG